MKTKILCVDDEEAVLNFMQLFLSKHYDVYTAQGGEEALEVIEAHGPIDLVLSDVQMPGINGVDLVEKIKSITSDTICIMLTGHSDFTKVQELLDSGKVYKYMVKPVLPKKLLETIDEAISHANPQEGVA